MSRLWQKGRKIRLYSKYKTAGALELIGSVRGLVYGKSLVRDITVGGFLLPKVEFLLKAGQDYQTLRVGDKEFDQISRVERFSIN